MDQQSSAPPPNFAAIHLLYGVVTGNPRERGLPELGNRLEGFESLPRPTGGPERGAFLSSASTDTPYYGREDYYSVQRVGLERVL